MARVSCQQHMVRAASTIASLARSHIFLETTILAFIAFYMTYVNTQPCLPLECSYVSWINGFYPSTLSTRRWFNHIDWNWMANYWTIPCQPGGGILSRGIARLATFATVGLTAFSLPAMITALTVIIRPQNGGSTNRQLEHETVSIITSDASDAKR